MPYSKRQLAKILNADGQPVISPDARMGLAARVTESFIRRRLFHIEDETVVDQFAALKRAYGDIRTRALDLAQRQRIDTLGVNAEGILWRRDLDRYIATRLGVLADELAGHTLRKAGESYVYSYFGRAWSLDMATKRDVHIKAPIPSNWQATRGAVQPALEAFRPDLAAYELFGLEWQQQYTDTLNDGARRIRNQLSTSLLQGVSVLGALNAIGDVLGVQDGAKGAAGRLGTLTRSNIQGAAVSGTDALYKANQDIVLGVRFVALPGACPRICAPLDGTQWALGDPDIVYPVSGTHPNCRCGHLPLTASDVEIASDTPPEWTWSEWLRNNGIDWLFVDEFTGSAIDSERV